MRTEPGPLSRPCLYCGGEVWAVRVCSALMPECAECGRSPAQAYLDKYATSVVKSLTGLPTNEVRLD